MVSLRKLLMVLLFALLSGAAFASPININSADAATIAAVLDGVGPVKAQAIVEHREKVAPYRVLEDLLQVNGIGPATIEKNRDRIIFSDTSAQAEGTAGSGS